MDWISYRLEPGIAHTRKWRAKNRVVKSPWNANREIGVPGAYQSSLRTGFPASSNLSEVLTQRGNNLFPPAVHDILAQFFERDVHDVVMMQFLGRDFVAEFEPEAVEQVDFLGC